MTDREMLELAAKAAGMNVRDWTPTFFAGEDELRDWPHEWNPLVSDGDAFRLAVGLRITPHIGCNLTEDKWSTEAEWSHQGEGGFVWEPHIDDPLAATRRAIVRAASEIGRNMK